LWLTALLDGSLSVGRVTSGDKKRDQTIQVQEGLTAEQLPRYSGFLLRSEVVSGWPDLHVAASSSIVKGDQPFLKDNIMPLVRMERLSDNVLICIFEGEVQTLDIFLKPTGLQFGFKEDENNPGKYFKIAKNPKTGLPIDRSKEVLMEWRNPKQRIVDIEKLVGNIPEVDSSASFAFQMMEGAPKVRFSTSSSILR
jgi:hypothetical protein